MLGSQCSNFHVSCTAVAYADILSYYAIVAYHGKRKSFHVLAGPTAEGLPQRPIVPPPSKQAPRPVMPRHGGPGGVQRGEDMYYRAMIQDFTTTLYYDTKVYTYITIS